MARRVPPEVLAQTANPVSIQIKDKHIVHVRARRVQAARFRIDGQIFEAIWASPFGYCPFRNKLPI